MIVRLALSADGKGGVLAAPLSMRMRWADACLAWNGLYSFPIGLESLAAGSEIEAEILYSESAGHA